MKKWTDLQRDDLKSIPEMVRRGFTPIFNEIDLKHKRVTPDKPPQIEPVEFLHDTFLLRKLYKSTSKGISSWWRLFTIQDIKDYENIEIFLYGGENKDLSFNDRLLKAGVKTILKEGYKNLEYNGIVVPRPTVNNIEKICLQHFKIII